MPAPISIRLDDEVRATLEAEARSRGVGLATYLRQIAAEAARNVRRRSDPGAERSRRAVCGRNDPGRATSTESGAHPRPTPIDVPSFEPGQIVIVEWRDALPKEANRRRPAVVIEDAELFDPAYPNVILVPLTEDATLVIADLISPDRSHTGERLHENLLRNVAAGDRHVEGEGAWDGIARYHGAACGHPATGGRGDSVSADILQRPGMALADRDRIG